MKRLILFGLICFGLIPAKTSAQWVEITNGQNTTQNYGGVDVTVTAVNPDFNGGCEGTYWIASTNDSYTFTFSQPVSAVQFYCDAINTTEETAFLVNGQPFSLTNCNVAEYINSCSPGLCSVVNGVFVNNTTMGLCGGLITVYGNITSVTVLQQFGNSGTTFDVYFPPDSAIPAPSGTITAGSNSPVNCGDMLNLTATASGATSYSWTGPNSFTSTQQNPSFQVNNNSSGQYIVTAQTPCGALIDTVDVVVAPYNYLPPVSSNSPVCEGGVLSLSTPLVANGTYAWTGPNAFSSSLQSPVINPVQLAGAGTYSLVVTVNNCSSQTGTTLVDVVALPPAPITADISYCLGDTTAVPLTAQGNNLSWYFVPAGGTPIPGGAPTPNTTTAGTITYYVSSTGPGPTFCEGPRAPLDVTIFAHPILPNIAYKNSYCANEPFEPFTVISGQNILYYTQAIGGVGDPNAPSLDPTIPGTYQWFATQNVNGCESSRFPITIVVHPFIQSNFTYDVHWGCKDDSIQFTNTSVGAFAYEWHFGDYYTDSAMNPLHVYDTQGIYTIQLISTAPYCRDTFEQTVDLNHPLNASFTTDFDTICQHSMVNFTNTSVTTTINGIPPTYTWSFGDGGIDFMPTTAHTYDRAGVFIAQMIVTDFVPCKDTAFKYIIVDSISGLEFVANDSNLCAGEAVTFTGMYHEDGLIGVTWDYGDGQFAYDMNPARHTYEQPGTYNIKINTDYRLCRDTSAELQVNIKPYPMMNLGPDTSMCPTSEALVLHDLINGGNPAAKWLWNTGETSFSISVKQPGFYSARVELDGCGTSDTVWVKKDCYLDIPNVFTPNGDNMNDYFLPRAWLSEGMVNFKMSIYNRWGQEVYTTKQLNGRGWDGKFNGVDQPQGVYVYVIEAVFKNGVSEKKQGNVTLMR